MTTQAFPKPITITLENYKIPSWNILYAGKHWSTRQEMKEEADYSVMEALNKRRVLLPLLPIEKPVEITIIGHFKRPIDCDNISTKLIIDALKGKVIIDDTPKYVTSVTSRSVKSDHDYAEVIINY